MRNEDPYPLALLTGYTLMPTNSGNGVMAVCDRHEGAVSALVVNSLSDSPLLSDLAFMAGEHEAEHHGGPAMPEADIADNPLVRLVDDPEMRQVTFGLDDEPEAWGTR